ncbi:hypothetical protein [Dyella japonica]|uniref:Polyketide cyclase n=1 Tax=Dyella japonica DSM 16301 TaxID=1440762 RepID=A0A0G9H8Q9_9GAMM|nr:hypothetical protein [Dyella japonica]KLD66155.1 hypothetical protein Y882_00295 [Dyella japonica DSM 16301]
MDVKIMWIGSMVVSLAIGLGVGMAHSQSGAQGGHGAPGAHGLHGALHAPSSTGAAQMYAERDFEFDLPGTVAALTPYFGPVKEREWAPDWSPEFIRPTGGGQEVGAVFQTKSPWGTATWVMDHYAPVQGKVGYLIFIPETGVSRYDISLSQKDPATVHVHVWCSRTPLKSANPRYLAEFEQFFTAQGPEWRDAITGMLARTAAQPR